MIFRAIDSANDWKFGTGRQSYLRGADAIAANIKTRLQLFLGECFWDTAAGVDWWGAIGHKNGAVVPKLLLEIRAVLVGSFGVVKVNDVSVSLIERRLTVSYSVDTIYSRSSKGYLTAPL